MARFYVTTPIYYINARPHVGSAYTTIAADTLARYHRLRGDDTFFLTGTDEHGQKIEQAAAAMGLAPKAFADDVAKSFLETWPKLGIAPDQFIRTTDPQHEARVAELWTRVKDNGDIYLGDYEGWYCVADEAFYTEKELVNGLSPTGRPVERVKEASYFFKLGAYRDRLLAFYEEHPDFVEPEGRFNEVKAFVRGELFDLSVSRTTFTWGVPVPGDPKHVMYVWFDALANYWTALGGDDDARQRFWPCDVHLVGKEITRFHAVYWPAFLMAAGLPLPKKIFAHGWLTADGEKMSKSVGNVVDPLKVADEVGVDALRYYLLRAVSFGLDGDFSHHDLLARINGELGNNLGNLLNRTLGLCAKYTGGKVPAYGEETELERTLAAAAIAAAKKAATELDAIAPHRALETIFAFGSEANTYVDRAAPWTAAKKGDTARIETILATLLEACRHLSVMIAPVMPEKSAEMRRQLALEPIATKVGDDLWPSTWAPRAAGATLAAGEPLFPRLDDDRQKAILERLAPPRPAAPAAVATATAEVATEVEPQAPEVTYDDFAKLDLRVGHVVSAVKVPKKDKLLDLRVDLGEAEPRRIVAGLALSFKPEDLVGKRVVVVANLAPRDFGKGLVSHGMLLAAGPSEALVLAAVPDGPPPGTRVK
jgi:methionyl-tRNA synthetase